MLLFLKKYWRLTLFRKFWVVIWVGILRVFKLGLKDWPKVRISVSVGLRVWEERFT